MPVAFNHTIVQAHDAQASATFLSEILGLPAPQPFGPFLEVPLDHHASFDFITNPDEFPIAHYAFLVTEAEFDEIHGRIVDRGLDHWADPHQSPDSVNQINHNDGGRGVYWCDPGGHLLEIITVPYGGWPEDGTQGT